VRVTLLFGGGWTNGFTSYVAASAGRNRPDCSLAARRLARARARGRGREDEGANADLARLTRPRRHHTTRTILSLSPARERAWSVRGLSLRARLSLLRDLVPPQREGERPHGEEKGASAVRSTLDELARPPGRDDRVRRFFDDGREGEGVEASERELFYPPTPPY